jgi:calcineurin-like phosphoesterase family protein
MNEEIVLNWNKTVRSKDIVYVIGDVTFGKFDETKAIVSRLNGKKILIRGNHDERFSSKDWIDIGFSDVRDIFTIKIDKEKYILSHFPYSSSFKFFFYKIFNRWYRTRNEANYYKLYLPYKGYKLIHGHHHEGSPYEFDQINVAWDVNKRLVSEMDIKELAEKNKVSGCKRFINMLKLILF